MTGHVLNLPLIAAGEVLPIHDQPLVQPAGEQGDAADPGGRDVNLGDALIGAAIAIWYS